MADPGKRPFWMHQLVEYILGVALLASGMQSPQPVVPSVLGGIIIMHAAVTRGSLAAFRLIDRKLHRVLDPFIIGLEFVAAAQPWISVDNGTRMIIAAIAVVHTVVWLGSSYTERTKSPPVLKAAVSTAPTVSKDAVVKGPEPSAPPDRATSLGQSAGRFVGSGVKAVRDAKAKRTGS